MLAGPALLFCPADRPERFAKAAAAADAVILDLEDGVAREAKDRARAAVVASSLDPARTIVRINPSSSGLWESDLAALAETPYRTVMLPKAESAGEAERLAGFEVIALCESPRGVRNADELAASPNVVALSWGAEDLVAALGGTSSRFASGEYRQYAHYARSRVLIAAASEGKAAFDTVHLDIADQAGLRAEADDARASGFAGAMCIHPSQVELIRAAFRPSADEVAWARGVLSAAAAASGGVFVFEGRMVDEPLLRQARQLIARAHD
ncbi:HpcH/HpaI aldolase/citrate lyase family protein [Lysinimonas soli]|uniref:HpcH/HpaI aldolase/citrate lyase family protein n=1 Tax=Lysinimonas soli TaxID=1074233 RepID=A0ABW0NPC8_9MICO